MIINEKAKNASKESILHPVILDIKGLDLCYLD